MRGSIARPLYMSTRKKLFSGVFALALLATAVFFVFQANRGPRAETQKSAPTVPVTAVPVVLKNLPVSLVAVGNVEAYTTVSVKARVDGQLEFGVRFKEGDEVEQERCCSRSMAGLSRRCCSRRRRPYARTGAARSGRRAGQALQGSPGQGIHLEGCVRADAHQRRRRPQATVGADRAAVENASAAARLRHDPLAGHRIRRKILIQQGNLVKANDRKPLVTINQVGRST